MHITALHAAPGHLALAARSTYGGCTPRRNLLTLGVSVTPGGGGIFYGSYPTSRVGGSENLRAYGDEATSRVGSIIPGWWSNVVNLPGPFPTRAAEVSINGYSDEKMVPWRTCYLLRSVKSTDDCTYQSLLVFTGPTRHQQYQRLSPLS